MTSQKYQGAEFEYQELCIQLEAMKKKNVASRDLDPSQRQEIIGYIQSVVERRKPTESLGSLSQQLSEELPNTKWRLAFSTEQAAVGDLPKDASVFLAFDGIEQSSQERRSLDYILQFSPKTLGLKNLKAKSSYIISNIPNPQGFVDGVIEYTYESITSDIFGFANVNVGLFGLLKGRTSYIQTAYFDGRIWIEYVVGEDSASSFTNVYVNE